MAKKIRRSKVRRQLRKVRRKRRYHHGDLRRAMIDAALRLVETEGAEALTLRAAARLAGVSQAAPYRHFTNKEALLAAVAEEGFRALGAAMRGTATESRSPASGMAERDRALERMRALGLGYVGFAVSHPAHFRVMFGREVADRSVYPALHEAAAKTFRALVEAIAGCQRAGLVRSGEPEELALTAWASVHGISSLLVAGQRAGALNKPPAELAKIVTRNLLLGLGARPEKSTKR